MTRIPPELEGEYIIRVMDMPDCLNGMVKYDENDFANIYINAHLSPEGRRKAADHELTHVINDDIHNRDDIRTIEARADGHTANTTPLPRLMKARDLLPQSQKLPRRSEEVARRIDMAPRPPVSISPRQADVLLRAINDLDDWLFRDTSYDI